MRKRELLLGFGAGLIVAASILGLSRSGNAPVPASFTQEQMKEAAQAMQMVVLSKEEYEQWQQEKKVHVKPAPVPPKDPQAPAVGQTAAPQVKQPATPQAEATAAPQVPVAKPPQSHEPSSPNAPAKTARPEEASAPSSPPVPQARMQPKKTVSFTIPYKATAEGVARILVDKGILPADNTFVEDLRAQDKLNRIRVGTYQVLAPATESDIVKLITTPPKK